MYGLQPLEHWDPGFESRPRHRCVSASFCVVLSCVASGLVTGCFPSNEPYEMPKKRFVIFRSQILNRNRPESPIRIYYLTEKKRIPWKFVRNVYHTLIVTNMATMRNFVIIIAKLNLIGIMHRKESLNRATVTSYLLLLLNNIIIKL
jgi:hypothetical protein